MDIWRTLAASKDMLFLAGPRQSGKTTLAQLISKQYANSIYCNWDAPVDRGKIIRDPEFFEKFNRTNSGVPLVIFDEIHKYRKWKNYLKGTYDKFKGQYHFLILGSGRLNVFQKGGDSLAGRYFQFHLWPLTLAELASKRLAFREFVRNPIAFLPKDRNTDLLWDRLAGLSGFPEPHLNGHPDFYSRWAQNYRGTLIREDIRQITGIKHIDEVEVMFSLLPEKIGSPLSVASLARDLQISPTTAQSWIKTLESMYLVFMIRSWTKKIARGIKKERKLYLFDYGEIGDPAAKFENMVALELLRAVTSWNDLGLGRFGLYYLKNKEKEEVDFLISDHHSPMLLIETKLSDDHASKNLIKFQNFLNVPAVQLVQDPGTCKLITNGNQKILIAGATRWLPLLP